jgi:hypothetical protein
VILYTGPEKRILAGGTASRRQTENGILHRIRAVAIHDYALLTL